MWSSLEFLTNHRGCQLFGFKVIVQIAGRAQYIDSVIGIQLVLNLIPAGRGEFNLWLIWIWCQPSCQTSNIVWCFILVSVE